MRRDITIALLGLMLAGAASVAGEDVEPRSQWAKAMVFCGWAIAESPNEQAVGIYQVTRNRLVPGPRCVLSISMFDEGSPSIRDDEMWQSFWVEIPEAPFVGVVECPRAFSHSFSVFGDPEETDRSETVKVTVLARSTSGVTAEIELTHLRSQFSAEVDFVAERPYEEEIRKLD